MFNYLSDSYKKTPISLISRTILPDITNKNNINENCLCCKIHKNHGCSNTIGKNGNKIWYVLHNLVESIKTPILHRPKRKMRQKSLFSSNQ